MGTVGGDQNRLREVQVEGPRWRGGSLTSEAHGRRGVVEAQSQKYRAVIGDGAEEGAAADPSTRYLALTGGGEQDMVDEGRGGNPMVVGEERGRPL